MEHAMNEKMREKVNEGKLDEATYKELVEELGRLKGEPDAPLYEVTYTENMIVANSRRSDDPPELQTRVALFKKMTQTQPRPRSCGVSRTTGIVAIAIPRFCFTSFKKLTSTTMES